jgi:primase-polymerase (primpol)-like protein
VPLTVDGRPASSTDPTTWANYRDASRSTAGVGVGFVLGGGIGCIDLDHCLDDGALAPWAQDILDACPATYVEVSPSGTGLHVWGRLAEARGRKIRRDGQAVEIYSTGRYITVSGKRWGDCPTSLAALPALL